MKSKDVFDVDRALAVYNQRQGGVQALETEKE